MKVTARPLSPELKKKVESELNETPKKLDEGIQHLRDWILKQPHLKARTDDQWLTAFLRGCKHSLERAKEKVDLYYSLRHISPEFFQFRPRDPRFKELLRTGAVLILPKLAKPEDPRIVVIRPSLYDPNKISTSEFFSFCYILQQIMYMEDDAFMVNGCITIVDLEGASMSHFIQLTPTQMKKLIVAGQDASPLRMKSIHLINSLPVFESICNLAIKLLHERHRDRIFVHSKGMSALPKHICKDTLPLEYGGQGGSTQEIVDCWQKKIDAYESWFDEDTKYGTDESKRPNRVKIEERMFGLEGSFRRLELD